MFSCFFLSLGIAQFQRILKGNSFGASKIFPLRDTVPFCNSNGASFFEI